MKVDYFNLVRKVDEYIDEDIDEDMDGYMDTMKAVGFFTLFNYG